MAEPISTVFGIKATPIVAGILGGAVRALLTGGGWVSGFVSVFVGGVTSNYFTDTLVKSPLNYWEMSEGTVGFLIGLTSMLICEGILKRAKIWSRNPTIPQVKP